MALAIPEVFGAGALTFGLSYLFRGGAASRRLALKGQGAAKVAIFGVAPFQCRRFRASHRGGVRRRALGVGCCSSRRRPSHRGDVLRRERRFTLNAAHFAERHGGSSLSRSVSR